jgi:hypothetical protein
MFRSFSLFRMAMPKTSGALASAMMLLIVAGCGDDALGKRYPVSGKVTYKGKPLAVGSISFYPTGGAPGSEARGATGSITDGYYNLSTIGGDDGAFPGEYAVAISARKPDMSQAQANQAKTGGSFRQDDVAKAYASASSDIPKKYESTEQSGLKRTIVAGSNTFNFDLTD